MTVIQDPEEYSSSDEDPIESDPLLPWLRSIKKSLDALRSSSGGEDLGELVSNCIRTFKDDDRYRDDIRFLKIWFLHMDATPEFESVFREMLRYNICSDNSLLYESYALFLEAKGRLSDAFVIYQLGISRNAQPVDRLKNALILFRDRMSEIVNACSLEKMGGTESAQHGESCINPWSASVIKDLLQKKRSEMSKYDGYQQSAKPYPGKVSLSSLPKSAKNQPIDIGGKKYLIKGCAGKGGFAQVFRAFFESNPDDVVALKIQKPAFPWEFYMYRQLDKRIPANKRSSFGFAHRLHLYSDYSVLVSDYLAHGTLQDAINYNAVIGGFMEEVLCIYYTIEMLSMLETLHSTGLIHGDFKPDNLLMRYSRNDLPEDCFRDRAGSWEDQGLCLVDWGRGIDTTLFPDGTKFNGDCRTSGFRCVEMQEGRPWTFQVDTYGLCVIVHMMLHNSYMAIEKNASSNLYQPKAAFKRYWQVNLWRDLFTTLLNINEDDDHKKILKNLRESFQDYMCSSPQLIAKLKHLLVKQKTTLLS